MAAYYVVGEALTNVAKHARASLAEVQVTATDEALTVTVADDGVGGADLPTAPRLIRAARQVEALGGTISTTSAHLKVRPSSAISDHTALINPALVSAAVCATRPPSTHAAADIEFPALSTFVAGERRPRVHSSGVRPNAHRGRRGGWSTR